MLSNQTMWYAARSAGIISWLLLSLSVIWGLLMSTKIVRGGAKRGWLLGVHRSLGGFSVIFTLIHVIALMLDSYIHFGFLEVLVPFSSEWKPIPVAFGVVSFWIIMAVEISSLLKKHLPTNLWKYIHVSSLGLFMTAAVHGYMSGTDAHLLFFLLAIAIISSPIGMLTIIRFTKAAESPPNARTAGIRERASAKAAAQPSANTEQAATAPTVAAEPIPSTEPVVSVSAEPISPNPYAPPATSQEQKVIKEVQPSAVQSTQWVTETSPQPAEQGQPQNELPPLVELPEMTHQKLHKKHRGISSLFDSFEPLDRDDNS